MEDQSIDGMINSLLMNTPERDISGGDDGMMNERWRARSQRRLPKPPRRFYHGVFTT
jgi:hypothetical protein